MGQPEMEWIYSQKKKISKEVNKQGKKKKGSK